MKSSNHEYVILKKWKNKKSISHFQFSFLKQLTKRIEKRLIVLIRELGWLFLWMNKRAFIRAVRILMDTNFEIASSHLVFKKLELEYICILLFNFLDCWNRIFFISSATTVLDPHEGLRAFAPQDFRYYRLHLFKFYKLS